MTWHSLARRIGLAVLLLVLSGCGGGDEKLAPSAMESPASLQATVPPVAGTLEVGAIVWATQIDPTTAAPVTAGTAFPVTIETLYATMPVANIPGGAAVSVQWWFNGELLDQFSQTATLSSDYGKGWLEFHLTRQEMDDWPEGTYEIAVSLDGTERQRSAVTLGKPAT